MSFGLSTSTGFLRDVKSLTESQQIQLKEIINSIIENPKIGKHLKGNMKGYLSLPFGRSPELRIIYEIFFCTKTDNVCRFEECSSEDKASCLGNIHLNFVKTREECNNLYALKKKFFKSRKRH